MSEKVFLKSYFLFKPLSLFQKCLKDRVHCFLMQVVINKYFLLNPEKNLAHIRLLVVFEKNAKKCFNFEK